MYRAIDTAREANLIIKRSDRYYWFEDLQEKVYGSELEATKDLEHSENLASGLLSLLKTTTLLEGTGIEPKPIYVEDALQHLAGAYRMTHQDYVESQKNIKQANEKEVNLSMRIDEALTKEMGRKEHQKPGNQESPPPPSVGSLVRKIVQDYKSHWLGGYPENRDKLYSQNIEIKLDEKNMKILSLLGQDIHSEIIKETRAIIDLEYRHYIAYSRFEDLAVELIMKVVNGSPLSGRCRNCPRIRIVK